MGLEVFTTGSAAAALSASIDTLVAEAFVDGTTVAVVPDSVSPLDRGDGVEEPELEMVS